jgi:hypothetical protein
MADWTRLTDMSQETGEGGGGPKQNPRNAKTQIKNTPVTKDSGTH